MLPARGGTPPSPAKNRASNADTEPASNAGKGRVNLAGKSRAADAAMTPPARIHQHRSDGHTVVEARATPPSPAATPATDTDAAANRSNIPRGF